MKIKFFLLLILLSTLLMAHRTQGATTSYEPFSIYTFSPALILYTTTHRTVAQGGGGAALSFTFFKLPWLGATTQAAFHYGYPRPFKLIKLPTLLLFRWLTRPWVPYIGLGLAPLIFFHHQDKGTTTGLHGVGELGFHYIPDTFGFSMALRYSHPISGPKSPVWFRQVELLIGMSIAF